VSDALLVKGWCFSPQGMPVTATLFFNGVEARRLVVTQPRPDVVHAFPNLDVREGCGFAESVPTSELPCGDGRVSVRVDARDTAGHALSLPPVEIRKLPPSIHDPLSAEQLVWRDHDQIEFSRSDEALAGRLEGAARIAPTDIVVEIGCGAGRTARHLAPRCRRWIGIDIDHSVLGTARALVGDLPNVALLQSEGVDLGCIRDQAVNVVYCSLIFMLLREWDRFRYVREAFRVLKPGGRLYVDTMNLLGSDAWEIFLRLTRLPPRHRPSNACSAATPEELETYFLRAGFSDVRSRHDALLVECTGARPTGH
jgi:SAM-dependent methyltransferase